jgi:hypothetical protein
MSDFNISSWKKNQYLAEAGLGSSQAQTLANLINDAIMQVDESLSYRDFAVAVAIILKEEYGTHNFGKFMDVLHAELGISESLNENEDLSSLEDFLKYFKSYDAYYEYIDDGGQYENAKRNNNRILARYNALSPEDKKTAFKAVQNHFKDERAINAFK